MKKELPNHEIVERLEKLERKVDIIIKELKHKANIELNLEGYDEEKLKK